MSTPLKRELRRTRRGGSGVKETSNIRKVVQKAKVEDQPTREIIKRVTQSKAEHAIDKMVYEPTVIPGGDSIGRFSRRVGDAVMRDGGGDLSTNGIPVRPGYKSSRVRRTMGPFERYVSALMLPEQYGEGMTVPDEFGGKSASVKLLINKMLSPLTASYAFGGRNNFSKGTLLVRSSTAWCHCLSSVAEFKSLANEVWVGPVVRQSNLTGLFPLSGNAETEAVTEGAMVLTVSSQNLVFPFTRTKQSDVYPLYPFLNYDGNGDVFYGHSINFTGASINFALRVVDLPADTLIGGLAIEIVNAAQVVATILLDVKPDGTATKEYTFNSVLTGVDCRGDAMVGFRVRVNNQVVASGAAPTLTAFSATLTFSTEQQQLNWQPISIPNFSDLDRTYSKYKTVAMSLLSSWMGGLGLNDQGGTVSSCIVPGGTFPTWYGSDYSSLPWTFAGMTAINNSYNGKAEKGTYSWWYPTSYEDYDFKDKNSLQTALLDRAILHRFDIGQSITESVGTNTVRVRMCVIRECTTTVPYIPMRPSYYTESVLTAAKAFINKPGLPVNMENDLHTEIIKWVQLPLDIANEAVPKFSKLMESAGPILKMLGFSLF